MIYTDLETWQLFKSGDTRGFDLLYRRYSQFLYGYGMKICADEEIIRDMIHDLFVDLWSRSGQLPDLHNIKSYLFKALRNKLLKRMSIKKIRGIEELPDNTFSLVISHEISIIQNEEDKLIQTRLQKALDKLTEHQREILYLKFNEGLNYNDIAEITQINYQSVVNIIYRTINVLRKNMGLSLAALLSLLSKLG
ncbi:MAG TPA: sigma-70 family RNA polymerase sigma factor [Anseongella sp.]|nr:sigma-70 family RNA polymerase sigma factor [Anseongella sp.]